ncbi:3-dehydroquinate synthase [Kaustia mangrovi]|uniref:3-dehydroquinate synthase n=1 Tax=Kaustia mangrovi TaxID=2593653 RepID=A0A7S8C2Z5_9HYPH|nr:3-dehydroquinate synthase [Kaustia mangrovi]QPC42428.1 3-dehydroquinate synthase [Kaustia mangrovi]
MSPTDTIGARPADSAITVPVALGARAYDIHIGPALLERAGTLVAPLLDRPVTAIVTDETVADLHLARLERALDEAGIATTAIVVPAGEASKSFATLETLCDRLLDAGIERRDRIVALGGGVIGDLTGFAAAILRRGVDFIQIPTTLLAQVDSSVGGKTGINSSRGKNLIGAFHQPVLVLADLDLLDTLPAREFRAGYAEVAKYGLLGDRAFFEWLETDRAALFAGDKAARRHAVEVSCRMKAEIVEEDEREAGRRALLNLGHTFGHALEAATGYGNRLIHGEAVALGTAQAFRYSQRLGLCPPGTAERVRDHLAAAGLPTTLGEVPGELPDAAALLEIMRQDKKASRGRLTLVLARDIGEAFTTADVDEQDLATFLDEEATLS